MTRSQALLKLLKEQAQGVFWQYEAKGEAMASRIAVSAYKSSFFEFLQFVSEQHHIKKLTQIRKKHVTAYITHLKRMNSTDFFIAKRVYAICFWMSMVDIKQEGFPCYESFDLEHPLVIQARNKNAESEETSQAEETHPPAPTPPEQAIKPEQHVPLRKQKPFNWAEYLNLYEENRL